MKILLIFIVALVFTSVTIVVFINSQPNICTNPAIGDLNSDGIVNIRDLSILLSNWSD